MTHIITSVEVIKEDEHILNKDLDLVLYRAKKNRCLIKSILQDAQQQIRDILFTPPAVYVENEGK